MELKFGHFLITLNYNFFMLNLTEDYLSIFLCNPLFKTHQYLIMFDQCPNSERMFHFCLCSIDNLDSHSFKLNII